MNSPLFAHTGLINEYLVRKFLNGHYMPGALDNVPPFGELSDGSIGYLIQTGIIDDKYNLLCRVRLYATFSEVDKPTRNEEGFNQVYRYCEGELHKRFGHVAAEDVILAMRNMVNGKITKFEQTIPFPTIGDMRAYIQSDKRKLTQDEIDTTFASFPGLRKTKGRKIPPTA
jgi:hypothetical protein